MRFDAKGRIDDVWSVNDLFGLVQQLGAQSSPAATPRWLRRDEVPSRNPATATGRLIASPGFVTGATCAFLNQRPIGWPLEDAAG